MLSSLFWHSWVHVLCRIRYQSDGGLATGLEFKCMVLGAKLALLWPLAAPLLRGRYFVAVLPDNTRVLLRYGTADSFILKEVYAQNIYEKYYHPKPGDTVFDVGSHIGVFTLKASRLIGYTGVVWAFEPEPENFMLLRRNIALNNASNIKAFKKAVSSRKGTLRLYTHPTNTGGSSVQFATGKASTSVSSITLDYIIQKHNIQRVNLLKLDVEGHELEVLRGTPRFLEICEHIAIETHERRGGPSNGQIIKELRKHRFKTELVNYTKKEDLICAWK